MWRISKNRGLMLDFHVKVWASAGADPVTAERLSAAVGGGLGGIAQGLIDKRDANKNTGVVMWLSVALCVRTGQRRCCSLARAQLNGVARFRRRG